MTTLLGEAPETFVLRAIEVLRPEPYDMLVLYTDDDVPTNQIRAFRRQLREGFGLVGPVIFLKTGAEVKHIPARQCMAFIAQLFDMPWADEKSLAAMRTMVATKEEA